jgi:hypothetical protein
MANRTYPKFLSALLSPGVNLLTATVKAALVSTTSGAAGANFPYSAGSEFLSDIPASAIIATSPALTGKAVANGALTAGSFTLPAVPAQSGGKVGQAVVLYVDTGTAGTSRLISFLDTFTGLPITPDGSDLTFNWSGSVITLAQP